MTAFRPARRTYRRDYQRPCRECHQPIINAARNQVMHPPCRRHATAVRFRLRRDIRRAAAGKFPGERVSLEEFKTYRRRPKPETASRYIWQICPEPDCGARFLAGKNARRCGICCKKRLRRRAKERSIQRRLVQRFGPAMSAAS